MKYHDAVLFSENTVITVLDCCLLYCSLSTSVLCAFLISCTLPASLEIKDGERCRICHTKGRKGLFEDLFKRKISTSKE